MAITCYSCRRKYDNEDPSNYLTVLDAGKYTERRNKMSFCSMFCYLFFRIEDHLSFETNFHPIYSNKDPVRLMRWKEKFNQRCFIDGSNMIEDIFKTDPNLLERMQTLSHSSTTLTPAYLGKQFQSMLPVLDLESSQYVVSIRPAYLFAMQDEINK